MNLQQCSNFSDNSTYIPLKKKRKKKREVLVGLGFFLHLIHEGTVHIHIKRQSFKQVIMWTI